MLSVVIAVSTAIPILIVHESPAAASHCDSELDTCLAVCAYMHGTTDLGDPDYNQCTRGCYAEYGQCNADEADEAIKPLPPYDIIVCDVGGMC